MGTLEQKWGPNGDPKTEKGPHGDRVPQMGTHVGTVETIEALFTFLTIENNNLNIHSDSSKVIRSETLSQGTY